MVETYTWPSQAFWRYFELRALRSVEFQRPILEIGCGDGEFTSMVLDYVDDAIDVNPRSVEKARSSTAQLYGSVRCEDARQLQAIDGGYGTIYANCVMEHIPDLGKVLEACYRSLRSEGTLVITVPLLEMNDHILLPWRWYAELRRKQLEHRNLYTQEQWRSLLASIGFVAVNIEPYLYSKSCRFWDSLDSVACIGKGRYNVSSALRLMARRILPLALKRSIKSSIAGWLENKITLNDFAAGPCAARIIATK